MAEESRPRLGRGLAALLGEAATDNSNAEKSGRRAPVEFLRPNPRNPRKVFVDDALDELASSIREKGLIQPIVVRPLDSSGRSYEIIAGERRWRAAQRAGLHEVPIAILNVSERESLEIAIVENVQRADLNPIEEARGYGQLIREFNYTQADLGKVIGKSRSHIANTMRLLNLPDSVLTMVEANEISAGHARALLAFDNPDEIAHRIVSDNLNVREIEQLARAHAEVGNPPNETKSVDGKRIKDPNLRDIEKQLSDSLGMNIEIRPSGDGGELRIRYASVEQFDGLCERLR